MKTVQALLVVSVLLTVMSLTVAAGQTNSTASVSLKAAGTNQLATNVDSTIPDLTTTTGKIYKRFEVLRIEPDGLNIMHSGGVAKVPFEELSDSIQKKYGYDPAKAAAKRHDVEAVITEQWGIVAEFGMITTVWVSPDGLKDKDYIAQVLHQIHQNNPNNAVWFFDDQRFAAKGVPMTDQQMLHWVGMYDKVQFSDFCYVQITDKTSSPPHIKLIKTGIMPGYTE